MCMCERERENLCWTLICVFHACFDSSANQSLLSLYKSRLSVCVYVCEQGEEKRVHSKPVTAQIKSPPLILDLLLVH